MDRLREPPVACWECDRRTAHPRTVTLQAATRRIGPRCYSGCYLPLVAPADTGPERVHGMLLIEPEVVDELAL